MNDTMNLECTMAFIFSLWAFSTAHYIVAVIAIGFVYFRAKS